MDAGLRLAEAGHLPVVPHLSHYLDRHATRSGLSLPYRFWMDLDLALLARCDGLLSIGSSPGADQERAEAERLGLPVWRSVDEVPPAFVGGTDR
jgi:hypothetical protein